ncbi:ABC transporter ATP-binding protein [Pseudofrankia inefficax]|uniref:ABC transporter related protein n=1 Tax=Pseudofrankia inefficax (strain DSM 45817 / CECT 9037 / DDB 130130 / EuI1c) TaxID=298654 RepID=E3J7X3_PSEI1|nr:ABC transporter ATP-binding protein [Pseudofrankia inefficax]ADP82021.1 ABC transporter related protein [Pseudofrankia inefficax]
MSAAALEAVELARSYGARTALAGLTFSVDSGEILGLLGPNGAGKTTTIRLLTTMLRPSSGTFSVAGVPSTRPVDIRRVVGALPESAGYPEHMTGLEYLRYHGRLFGLSRGDASRTSERLLNEVGLAERGLSRIATYSRGMRQRLGIARALVNNPAVVFLDEPTLGLDPAGQRQVLGIVRDIAQRRGATVVLSTHTLPDVEEVCTKVLILARGRVLSAGTVDEVTRVAAAPGTALLRVPTDGIHRAMGALTAVPHLTVEATEGHPDVLRLSLRERPDDHPDSASTALNAALRAVLLADVPVRSFEIEGSRLSDAFLSMTRRSER